MLRNIRFMSPSGITCCVCVCACVCVCVCVLCGAVYVCVYPCIYLVKMLQNAHVIYTVCTYICKSGAYIHSCSVS